MKNKFILTFLLVTGLCFSEMQAQVKQVTIIDDLETPVPNEGIIRIDSDPKITELIGVLSSDSSINANNFVKINGFRIQVYMSNNPKTARKEITDRQSLIQAAFPDIAIYKGYAAPNWKLVVGDFRTKEEADVFKQKMLKSIPELGKEMYIVQDIINISIQNTNE